MRASAMILLSCCALAACGRSPPDPRGVGRDEVLVQVSASGRADTRPNEASFTAGVSTIAASAAAASQGNNAAINRIVAALRGLGIRADDVQTRSITLGRIDYGANRGRFEANNIVEVRVRDLGRAGQAIAAATDAGANVLSGPNLRVADPEAAGRAAYARAYRVARVLAIRDAATAEPYLPAIDMAMERGAAQASEPPPVQPGLNSSEVRIRVDFALAPR